jgi:hypothetical protein
MLANRGAFGGWRVRQHRYLVDRTSEVKAQYGYGEQGRQNNDKSARRASIPVIIFVVHGCLAMLFQDQAQRRSSVPSGGGTCCVTGH